MSADVDPDKVVDELKAWTARFAAAERSRIARGIELVLEHCEFAEDGCGGGVVALNELWELLEWAKSSESADGLRQRIIAGEKNARGYYGRGSLAKKLEGMTWT